MIAIGELISVNDNWFEVIKVINEPKTLPEDMVAELRDLFKCSNSFRKENKLYLCRIVEPIIPI